MRRRPPAPRWQTPLPPGVDGSWGPDVARFARDELGLTLDRPQQRALNRALATIGGRLAHRVYLLSEGRQSGKTVTVRSLIGWALTAAQVPTSWSAILGLAFDKKQARIPYNAVLEDLRPIARRLGPAGRGGISLTRYLGITSRIAGRHRTYDVGSREARDAIRGLSTDLAPFDEVRTHRTDEAWAALLPTMAARPEPLAFLTSTAGDVRAVVLRALFDRGLRIIAGEEPAEGFGMTWYAAPAGVGQGDVEAARALDRDALRRVLAAAYSSTPAMAAGRITEATVRSELFDLSPAKFVAERLNLWVDELEDELLPAGVWARQASDQPIGVVRGRVVLGVEAVPSWRRASIVVALVLDHGDVWLGMAADLDSSRGRSSTVSPEELVDELERVADVWHPAAVAYSSAAAAAPHLEAWLTGRDLPGIALTGGDLRRASELWRAELVGARVRHADDPLLAAQLRVARPSGPIEAGNWYISVRASLGEVDAIRAGAWATWAAIAPEVVEVAPQIF